jgi:hypothetical protein
MISIAMMGLWVSYLSLAVIPILESEKATLSETIKTKEALLLAQSTAAELNAVDGKKVEQLPIRIERITRELVPVKEEIIKWRESNATDCNVSRLYGFDFVGVFNSAMLAADRQGSTESGDRNATASESH